MISSSGYYFLVFNCSFTSSWLKTSSFFFSFLILLTRVRPDVLQQTVVLSKSVQGVISLTSGSNVTGKSVSDVLTWDSVAILIDLGDVDLDRGVVLSLDDSVGSRALSWNVKLDLDTKSYDLMERFKLSFRPFAMLDK